MTAPLRVPAPKGYPRRSEVKRHLDRASVAWCQGRPYEAHRVLAEAGLAVLWPVFLRTATAWARRRATAALEGTPPPALPRARSRAAYAPRRS